MLVNECTRLELTDIGPLTTAEITSGLHWDVQWRCSIHFIFFFQAEDGIRDGRVTGVQTCALPISLDDSFRAPAAAGRTTDLRTCRSSRWPAARYPSLPRIRSRRTGRRDGIAFGSSGRSEERRVGKEMRDGRLVGYEKQTLAGWARQ